MPRGVLDVVGIHRPVQLELPAAVVIAAGVIKRNAPLPELRSESGRELRHAVEFIGGLRKAAGFEIGNCTLEDRLCLFGLRLRMELPCKRNNRDDDYLCVD